jgi:hypothetical protein
MKRNTGIFIVPRSVIFQRDYELIRFTTNSLDGPKRSGIIRKFVSEREASIPFQCNSQSGRENSLP